MSTEIYEGAGLYVTHYAGPAHEGDDRARWQFTAPDSYAQLTRPQVKGLIITLLADAWPEAELTLGHLTDEGPRT